MLNGDISVRDWVFVEGKQRSLEPILKISDEKELLITVHWASVMVLSGLLKPSWIKPPVLGFCFDDGNCLKCTTYKYLLRFIGYINILYKIQVQKWASDHSSPVIVDNYLLSSSNP